MRFLTALFFLFLMVGVPVAKAQAINEFSEARLLSSPLDFSADLPKKGGPAVPAHLRDTIVGSVRDVLVAYAGSDVEMQEMSVFVEQGVITTTCGFAQINGVRTPYVLQVDRTSLVYFRLNPPHDHVVTAGCLRNVSTVSIARL